MSWSTFLLLATIELTIASAANSRPHIVMIVGDDIGYNDVGWRNSRIHTPHLDDLAATGVKFEKYYTATQCTPSRASLLTGYYAHRLGMQRVIRTTQPYGIPLRYKLLSEKLAEVGYCSHAIGNKIDFADEIFNALIKNKAIFKNISRMFDEGLSYVKHQMFKLLMKIGTKTPKS